MGAAKCTNRCACTPLGRFHGKAPSKNKQEIRLQKAAEEIARRKNATSEISQHQEVEGLRKVRLPTARCLHPVLHASGLAWAAAGWTVPHPQPTVCVFVRFTNP